MFNNVFLTAIAGKTRLLVTHALHFLPQVDYIYTVVDGRIAERGTYTELLAREGAFARFAREFGARDEQEEHDETEEAAIEEAAAEETQAPKRVAASNSPLMQAEERNTGAVSREVYKAYLSAGNGGILIPLLALSLAFLQGAQVLSSYW